MTLMLAERAGSDSGCVVAVVAVRPAGARSLLRAPEVACVRRVDGDQRSGLDVRRHHRLDAVLEDRPLVRRRCRLALRSEERRGGKEGVGSSRSRLLPLYYTKNKEASTPNPTVSVKN